MCKSFEFVVKFCTAFWGMVDIFLTQYEASERLRLKYGLVKEKNI